MDLTSQKKAISRRRREISRSERADCKDTLLKWGFPKKNPLVDLLINVALLRHLEEPKAKAALEAIQNDIDFVNLIRTCYHSSTIMRNDITIGSNPVRDVVNYLVTDLDNGKY